MPNQNTPFCSRFGHKFIQSFNESLFKFWSLQKYIDGLKQPQITSRSKNEHQLNDIDCELGDPNCVESALNLFHGFMKNKLKSEEKKYLITLFISILNV